MNFLQEEKQGQLILLFNNFRSRLKVILKQDEYYVSINEQIKNNNEKRYDKTQDRLFYVDGVYSEALFKNAEKVINNYSILHSQCEEDLQKAKKSLFGRKAKVEACEKKLKELESTFNKYQSSIKKYNESNAIWTDRKGNFYDANSNLISERNAIFVSQMKWYFEKFIVNNPEILLAKQTEMSFEDNLIADFLLEQQKNFDIKKIEQEFDEKLSRIQQSRRSNQNIEF